MRAKKERVKNTRNLNFVVPAILGDKCKIAAARQGMGMQAWIIELLERETKDEQIKSNSDF